MAKSHPDLPDCDFLVRYTHILPRDYRICGYICTSTRINPSSRRRDGVIDLNGGVLRVLVYCAGDIAA